MSSNHPAGRRTAFITGASSGIGAATALARDGFEVAVAATRRENLASILAELAALGACALPVALDLRSPSSIEQSMAAVIDAFGEVDVLVNNAAGIPFRKASIEVTRADWDADAETTQRFGDLGEINVAKPPHLAGRRRRFARNREFPD